MGALFLGSSNIAQTNFWKETKGEFNRNRYFGYEFENLKKEREVLAEKKVKQRKKVVYSKKYSSKTTQEFDREGRIVRMKKEFPKRHYLTEYTYDSNGLLISLKTTNSNGKKSFVEYEYNADGKMTSVIWTNSKSEYYATSHKYDSEGRKVLTQNFRKDSLVPYSSLTQSYYEDGSRKSTVFRKKGKIKHEWKYDCKPEGELVNVKKKDQSTICVKEEKDSEGNRVVWTNEFNEKGNLTKIKRTYSADSILVKSETYDLKGNLKRSLAKNETGGFKFLSFNKKGEIASHYEYFFNDQKQEVKYVSRYRRYEYTRINKYDNSLKTLEVSISNRSTSVYELDYEFYQ